MIQMIEMIQKIENPKAPNFFARYKHFHIKKTLNSVGDTHTND